MRTIDAPRYDGTENLFNIKSCRCLSKRRVSLTTIVRRRFSRHFLGHSFVRIYNFLSLCTLWWQLFYFVIHPVSDIVIWRVLLTNARSHWNCLTCVIMHSRAEQDLATTLRKTGIRASQLMHGVSSLAVFFLLLSNLIIRRFLVNCDCAFMSLIKKICADKNAITSRIYYRVSWSLRANRQILSGILFEKNLILIANSYISLIQ